MKPTLYQRRQHSTKIPIKTFNENYIRRRHPVMLIYLKKTKTKKKQINKKINKAQYDDTVLLVNSMYKKMKNKERVCGV